MTGMGRETLQEARRVQEHHLPRDVWAYNVEEEMELLRDAAEEFHYVTVDMVLPGNVAKPLGLFSSSADFEYQTLKCNVDLTKLVQLRLIISNEDGERPEGVSSWRFHFGFDADVDLLSPEIDTVVVREALAQHRDQGICGRHFGELLTSSGMVLAEEIQWIFCGARCFSDVLRENEGSRNHLLDGWLEYSGMYTSGHLLQLLTSQSLPDDAEAFKESLDLFFPSRCDASHRLRRHPNLCLGDPGDRHQPFAPIDRVLEAFISLPEALKVAAFERSDVDLFGTNEENEAAVREGKRAGTSPCLVPVCGSGGGGPIKFCSPAAIAA